MGIRATMRGLTPIKQQDPLALYDLAVILSDCGLRPEEGYRLRWDEIQDDTLRIAFGKTENARRVIPLSERAIAVLKWRKSAKGNSPWVFPAPTMSGLAEQSTLRDQHAKSLNAAEVEKFVPYTVRHTCLTRWSAYNGTVHVGVPRWTRGFRHHKAVCSSTTRRSVRGHEKARSAKTPHNLGHSAKTGEEIKKAESAAIK